MLLLFSFLHLGLPRLTLTILGVYTLLYNTSAQDPAGSQQMPCNSCCQGPVGSQGTPGIPGVPGIPGNIGVKGEKGESIKGDQGDSIRGPSGEKGDMGDPGLKGDIGLVGAQGPPGNIGPAGIAGPHGEKGDIGFTGFKGQKGNIGVPGPGGAPGASGVKGQKGQMGQNRLSAFSAVRSTSFTPSSDNQALPFDVGTVHTNVGDDFDAASGRFTCEIPGIYLFTYSIMTSTSSTLVLLMKNDVRINSVYRQNENLYDMISNTAVLQLDVGDEVWLQCWHSGYQIYSDSDLYTTFSGVILHEV